MDNLEERLAAADPVDRDGLDRLSSEPIFDELFDSIVTAGDQPVAVNGQRQVRRSGQSLALPSDWDRHRLRRHGRAVVLGAVAACVAAIIVLAVVVPGSSGPSRGNVPGWRLVSDVTNLWTKLTTPSSADSDLACPSATTCYVDAVTNPNLSVAAIDVTHDSGATWHRSALPAPVWTLSPMSCVDQETCALLGSAVNTGASGEAGKVVFLETTDGGASWSVEPTPTTDGGALACTSRTTCIAVVSDVNSETAEAVRTTDSGATWSAVALPKKFVPADLSCSSASQCAVSGYYLWWRNQYELTGTVLVTSDGGTSWATASLPAGLSMYSHLACGGLGCVAVFLPWRGHPQQVLASSDGGRTWAQVAGTGLPGQFALLGQVVTGLSCPVAGQCWAAGAVSFGPPQLGPPSDLIGTLSSTSDGGKSWQTAPLPHGIDRVLDVSCATATSCYALAMLRPPGGPGSTTVTTVPFGTKDTGGGGSSGGQETPVLLAYGN